MAAPDGPNLERLYSINLDGSRNFLHPADVRGRFMRLRRITFFALIAFYLALPLVHIGGHPAVQLDIAGRRFYLFGGVFNAQDTWMMFFIFTSMAFALLLFTAWLGRVWCGWACPQTVFLEGIYRPVERFFEGTREQRIKLARAPWSLNKIARKAGKHLVFALISAFIGHVTLSLFVSGRALIEMMHHNPFEHPVAFLWTFGIAGAFYFNFAWFREQLCVIVCPYGRLQSALTDRDSLVIGYDEKRGEPRGKLGTTSGACVDCNRCVVVCPTGVDIRNGLQMECIACTQCIDACDEVMDKVGKPRGLIRYDSLRAFAGEKRRGFRPRLLVYALLCAGALTGLGLGLASRKPFDATLIRMRKAPYELVGTTVQNQYELHVTNKGIDDATFHLVPRAPADAKFVVGQNDFKLGSLESRRIPIFVTVERKDFRLPFEVTVDVTETSGTGSPAERSPTARFLGPIGAP